jgi:glycosyltransferase involved in cell wall biosynthesis
VEEGSGSDEVIFLGYHSADVRGLKLAAIRDIQRITRQRPFAFCIAHRFKPVYVALLGTKLPVIGVHHAFGDYRRRSRGLFASWFKRRLSLLGVSDAVRDDIRESLPSWPNERIETLYNRLDLNAIQGELLGREEAREALGLAAEAWVVGNVGRLHPDKDQETLLRGFAQALPHLPANSLLVIMGSGKLEGALKAQAQELGVADNVRFLGQVAHGRRYFRAFDVFALSSDHEPFGMVLLEAMAAGVALVVTDCGGGREVAQGVGELFTQGDAAGLANALQATAAASAEQRQARQHAMAAQLRERFSDDAVRAVFWNLPHVQRLQNSPT